MGYSTHYVKDLPKDIDSFTVTEASTLDYFDYSEWPGIKAIEKRDDKNAYYVCFESGEFALIEKI